MNDRVPFYGTFTLAKEALTHPVLAAIWQKALDSYDEDKLEWGITSVYSTTDMVDAIQYELGGLTDAGFDAAIATILAGSLNEIDTKRLYGALEDAKVAITYDINEYYQYADADDGLLRETGAIVVFEGKPRLKDVEQINVPISSATLVDLGFANESPYDDEELAMMLAEQFPEGTQPDDLVDAIEDVREDPAHGGVFTEEETDDPIYFAEIINSSSVAEADIE